MNESVKTQLISWVLTVISLYFVIFVTHTGDVSPQSYRYEN